MPAEVGGRLEAVAPRRSLFGPDYVRIAVLLAVAFTIHAWLIVHTSIPARDSLGYARVALNLSDPHACEKPPLATDSTTTPRVPRQRIDVIRTAEQPPGYPLTVWTIEKCLRAITMLPLPDRILLATQLANAIAAVLLVIPVYLIGRILFGRNVGFAASLLFQVLPVPARVTSDGLSEGVYLLVVVVAVLMGVRAARRPGIGAFLLCGLATGASYLVRPEGLLVGIAVGMVIGWAGLARWWPRDVALGRLTALGVGVALVALPYVVLIGKLSNKPTEQYLLNPANDQPAKLWIQQPGSRAPDAGVVKGGLFATWWDPKLDEGKCRELWALGAVWRETIKGLHYAIAVFAIVGLIARRRQLFAPDPGTWVLVVLGFLSTGLMIYLAARVGYVSERHTVLFVLIACVFAAASLEPVADFLGSVPVLRCLVVGRRATPTTLLVALVVTALPYTIKPMHPQREGHKHAGRWLATQIQDGDWLVDPFSWGEWYAGRTLYRTVSYDGQPKVTWAIVENGKGSAHSRLPQLPVAEELKGRGKLVYHWPENVPPEQASIQVYKVTHEDPKPADKK